MNEFEVIRRISEKLPQTPPEVLVPIGDDCAVLRLGDRSWALASDMLVCGHHFKGWATPEDVGYKAVAVNVSDVAAMGGTPRFVLASAEALTVDVAILGQLDAKPVLRSGARPGDLLAVTGELAASAAGLLSLESEDSGPQRLVNKHLRPEPRVEEGRAASRLGVGAMIDLSDGLASDARHLCERSRFGCRVDLDLLPVAADTRSFLTSLGHEPEIVAATGGEDYELLISAPQPVMEGLAESVGMPVTAIGEVTDGAAGVVFVRGGEVVEGLSGWDHFG